MARIVKTGNRGVLLALTAAGVAGLTACVVIACLPDLSAIPADVVPPLESGPVPTVFVGCGDGFIATLDDGGDAGESCDPGKPNDIDAQARGCVACQIVCEPNGMLDPRTGHCYFKAGADSFYNGALGRCQTAAAHVVTFASPEEVAFVAALPGVADDADAGSGYWVGLSRNPSQSEAYSPSRAEEPGFASPPNGVGPCDGCFGVGADAGVFPLEDPDASSVNCLVSRGGAWLQASCGSPSEHGPPRTTICEREPVGARWTSCFGGYCMTLPSTAGTKTYLVAVGALDPDAAAKSCTDLDGGSLVVLDSAEEREQLAHEIIVHDPTADPQELWIGLISDGGTWAWEDGIPLDGSTRPIPWGNAQPDAASPSARGYMRVTATAKNNPPFDTELSYADDGQGPRFYVCQRPP